MAEIHLQTNLGSERRGKYHGKTWGDHVQTPIGMGNNIPATNTAPKAA